MRTGTCQHQGVIDRAYAERRMVERVNPLFVASEERLDELWMLRPQLAETAARLRERAVHEYQQRSAVWLGRQFR